MPPSQRPRRSRSGRVPTPAANPPRKRANPWYIAAAIVVAILVIGGFIAEGLVGILPNNSGVGGSKEYVEGIGEQQEIMPTKNHVPDGRRVDYNTTPPTSGDHWDFPASCGFYPDGMDDEKIVHNLEHGNIVVSYNLPDAAVPQLEDFMDNFELAPAWAVTRYYDQIPENTVALSAWGVLDTMQGVDEQRIERFFRAYSGTLGPEFTNGLPCARARVMP